MKTVSQLKKLLPNREYWHAAELAKAFGVSEYLIRRHRKNLGLGKLVKRKLRGTYVYTEKDLEVLCSKNIGKRKEL